MIYFDMDGVLFKYDRDAYVGDPPKFKIAGEHYFRNLPADPVAMELFKQLIKDLPDDTYVLTGVSNEIPIRNEQIFDKMYALLDYAPNFDIGSKFLALQNSKPNYIKDIRGMSLNKTDILIDDYNANLYKWQTSGGTAIKYLNGVNTQHSWFGWCLDGTKCSADALIETMRRYLHTIYT